MTLLRLASSEIYNLLHYGNDVYPQAGICKATFSVKVSGILIIITSTGIIIGNRFFS